MVLDLSTSQNGGDGAEGGGVRAPLNNIRYILGRFPFDQKFRFEISKICCGKWNSKSGNFPAGDTSPGRPNRSIQFRMEISRNLRQRVTGNRNFFEWNSNFRIFRLF